MSTAPSCALGVTFFENTSDLNAFLQTYKKASKCPSTLEETRNPYNFVRRFTLTRDIYHRDAMRVMEEISKLYNVSYLYRSEGGIQFNGEKNKNKNVRFSFAGTGYDQKLFTGSAHPDDLALKFTSGLPSIAWENNFNVIFKGITNKNEARVVTLALVDHFNLHPFFQDFV